MYSRWKNRWAKNWGRNPHPLPLSLRERGAKQRPPPRLMLRWVMVKIPNYNQAFQDGAVITTNLGSANAAIEHHRVGELHLSSGRLVAADAGFAEENPFEYALAPGNYAV